MGPTEPIILLPRPDMVGEGEGEGGEEVVEVRSLLYLVFCHFFAMAGLALGVEHGAELNMAMKLLKNFNETFPPRHQSFYVGIST